MFTGVAGGAVVFVSCNVLNDGPTPIPCRKAGCTMISKTNVNLPPSH